MSQLVEIREISGPGPISCIVAPCSASKAKLPHSSLVATTLAGLSQGAAQTQWCRALMRTDMKDRVPAQDLYRGRALRMLLGTARRNAIDLYVISAGLGLIHCRDRVPAYDATVSPGGVTSLSDVLRGPWDAREWWRALQGGPFARPLEALCADKGRILVALTQPYAQMMGDQLQALPLEMQQRLRIFGAGIDRHLPREIAQYVIRYDGRLNVVAPGIALDFSARALAHFATLPLAPDAANMTVDQQLVDLGLDSVDAPPEPVKRRRAADNELLPHIRRLAADGLSIGKALACLRDEMQLACEQHRFRRLYEEVTA